MFIKNWLSLLLICVMSIGYGDASANNSHNTLAEIAFLKTQITDSTCVFTRNGVNYKGSEAITHINRKQDYFKEKIASTEDFVRLAATKSETSGLNYTVMCEQQIENLGDWLLKKLAIYRKQAKN